MTSFEFRQVMMFHAALLGNGCAYIGRIRGVPRELIPLVPGSYAIEQARDYTLTYRLTGPNEAASAEDAGTAVSAVNR
jgi:phage portal protein BeeE